MKQLRFDKSILPSLAACLLLPVYLELALHLFVYRGVSARIVYPLLFALAAGCCPVRARVAAAQTGGRHRFVRADGYFRTVF